MIVTKNNLKKKQILTKLHKLKQMETKNKTGYVYQLVIRDSSVSDSYVGSSFNVKKRRQDHKYACNNPNQPSYNLLVYHFIREHGGFENFELIVLQTYENITRTELKLMERKYIEQLHPTLNKRMPGRTSDEFRHTAEYKIYKRQIDHEYRVTNSDKIKKYQHSKIACPQCGCKITQHNMSTHCKTKKHLSNSDSETQTI